MSNDHSPSNLATWGLRGTFVYLIVLFGGIPVLWYFGLLTMKPIGLNELGDFLAGAFGPLAIFWLVLGFFQQGNELRLQVRELALSVEQQKELVGVTRETLNYERKVKRQTELERKESIQPRFFSESVRWIYSRPKS